jgi:hypothetical protein
VGSLAEQWKGTRALLLAFGGALIGANGLAAIIHRVLGRNMSWFASEHSALLLYDPATFGSRLPPCLLPNFSFKFDGLVGILASQKVLSRTRREYRSQFLAFYSLAQYHYSSHCHLTRY